MEPTEASFVAVKKEEDEDKTQFSSHGAVLGSDHQEGDISLSQTGDRSSRTMAGGRSLRTTQDLTSGRTSRKRSRSVSSGGNGSSDPETERTTKRSED